MSDDATRTDATGNRTTMTIDPLSSDPGDPGDSGSPGVATELLRFTTAGSVDDGKSTLIGRLLYDTKAIFSDQLESIRGASRRRGEERLNLALLTDGLRAEREQNITIDVAYRYFATPRRRFIIADTPGHIQYTRNMITGASTAELAIVLIDARKGVLTQSRRHGFLAALLGIPHLVVAVNKMDLVDFDRERYDEIVSEYRAFATKLEVRDLVFVPISALDGDNVVARSDRMPWYAGPTLLHHLEHVPVGSSRNLVDFRFPVQHVIRPHQDFRGLAGRVASGTIRPGEEVVALPSGRRSRIRSIETFDGPLDEAVARDSVVLTLDDEIDVGRGDMLARTMNVPAAATRFDAILCWMHDTPLEPGASYRLVHTSREVKALVSRLLYRIDVDTLHRDETPTLGLNDIGRVQVTSAEPVFFDSYQLNPATGGFILVDESTNATVAAGMIRGGIRTADELFRERSATPEHSPDAVWEEWNLSLETLRERTGHPPAVLWLTGLSGAGKSTAARAVERELFRRGCRTMLLDGDQLRHGLCRDLGFDAADRAENLRRAGEVAALFFRQGSIVICAFVSPFARDRDRVRALFPEGAFMEIHVRCALEECERRDPKGLYAKARAGAIPEFTGLTSPYEPPERPDLVLDTDREPPDATVERILELLEARRILSREEGGGGADSA